MLPAVSAAASWVESKNMPMREIRKKYTLSDMVIMSWDSRQKSYNMSKSYKPSAPTEGEVAHNSDGVVEEESVWRLPANVNKGVGIPKTFFNKDGELDLRLATGEQAVGYLRSLGLPIMPVISI